MGRIYKNKVRLDSPKSVRLLLGRTINALNDGDIEEGKARAIGYLANIMLKAFETEEIEERVRALEDSFGKGA